MQLAPLVIIIVVVYDVMWYPTQYDHWSDLMPIAYDHTSQIWLQSVVAAIVVVVVVVVVASIGRFSGSNAWLQIQLNIVCKVRDIHAVNMIIDLYHGCMA